MSLHAEGKSDVNNIGVCGKDRERQDRKGQGKTEQERERIGKEREGRKGKDR